MSIKTIVDDIPANERSHVGQYYGRINDSHTDALIRGLGTGSLGGFFITEFDGKIYAENGINGIHKEYQIVKDVTKLGTKLLSRQKKNLLAAAGVKTDDITPEDVYSGKYLTVWDEAVRLSKEKANAPYVPTWSIYGSQKMAAMQTLLAAAGQPTTPYEVVRRVNYLAQVTGPQFDLEKYNAINAVTVTPTADLNVKGFRRTAKLSGFSEIGDNIRPDFIPNQFAAYEKFLHADAFRFETTLRERTDSVMNLDDQFSQDIAGIFAELVDTKITTSANAVASPTTPTTDWDALTSGVYTSDASKDIEDSDVRLEDYGGADFVLWPRAVARAYLRNVNGEPKVDQQSFGVPTSTKSRRQWQLPFNEHITGLVNGSIGAERFVGISRQWGVLLQGPRIQVSYQDQMTPGQVEGQIIFNFNGFKDRTPAAADRVEGVLS